MKAVATNCYTLLRASDEFAKNCNSYIIELLPQYVNNFLIFNSLLKVLELLFPASELKEEMARKSFENTVVEFYENKVKGEALFSSVSIAKV